MCCAIQFLTLPRAAHHQGTAVGPPMGKGRERLPTSLPAVSPTAPHSYLQSQQLPHRCFTDPRLGVTEPSNPAQRHLGSVPRTAPSSPPHAWAQDPSYDDHKHGAVLCAIYFKIHCQAPSASKIKLLLQIMATLNI